MKTFVLSSFLLPLLFAVLVGAKKKVEPLRADAHSKCSFWADEGKLVVDSMHSTHKSMLLLCHCAPSKKGLILMHGLFIAGECDKNPKYMLHHCQTSCTFTDNHSKCSEWASLGECAANPKYMLHHCARACKKLDMMDEEF